MVFLGRLFTSAFVASSSWSSRTTSSLSSMTNDRSEMREWEQMHAEVIEARLLGMTNYANLAKLPREIVGMQRPLDIESITDPELRSLMAQLDESLSDLAKTYGSLVYRAKHAGSFYPGSEEIGEFLDTLRYEKLDTALTLTESISEYVKEHVPDEQLVDFDEAIEVLSKQLAKSETLARVLNANSDVNEPSPAYAHLLRDAIDTANKIRIKTDALAKRIFLGVADEEEFQSIHQDIEIFASTVDEIFRLKNEE